MRIRRSTACLLTFALLAFSAIAQAQRSCYECDPMTSMCDESCYYCIGPEHPDYSCSGGAAYTTCGEYTGACLRSNCAQNWVEISRVNVGTYGESSRGVLFGGYFPIPTCGCNHHRVDRVTERDTNQCNINSAYWERVRCDDWIDDFHPQREGMTCPDCCDPLVCPEGRSCYYDYTFTCNHWHSCF